MIVHIYVIMWLNEIVIGSKGEQLMEFFFQNKNLVQGI